MTEVKTEWDGIEITYDEKRNLWCFELRGRARTAESLEKAKTAIEAPIKEKKTFERIKAWRKKSWEGYKEIEITSIGEPARYGGGAQVWTTDGKNRSLESVTSVFPRNAKNDKIVEEFRVLDKQAEELRDRIDKLQQKLEPYEVPKETPCSSPSP